jgi:murein tripeptide amidase MpaA
VGPARRASLELELDKWSIPTEEIIGNVGEQIKRTQPPANLDILRAHGNEKQLLLSSDRFYRQFQRYSTIEAKIRELEQLDSRVSVETVGRSVEGRNIYLVKVSSDPGANKPIIMIDGGHHAREWISHATVMYLLESLVNIDIPRVSGYSCSDQRCREAVRQRARLNLNKYDYLFMPVINPDGYEYSHTSDRLWRKNRSGSFCRGVDLNRNYPFHWSESGSSRYSCSDIYSGPRAASEPEVKAVLSVANKYKDRIKMYLSFHCYSQLVLSPYGYARVYPDNYDELKRVADAYLDSVSSLRSTDYAFGTSAITLYPSSGGSVSIGKQWCLDELFAESLSF